VKNSLPPGKGKVVVEVLGIIIIVSHDDVSLVGCVDFGRQNPDLKVLKSMRATSGVSSQTDVSVSDADCFNCKNRKSYPGRVMHKLRFQNKVAAASTLSSDEIYARDTVLHDIYSWDGINFKT
jgi:predicted amino acid-binding ACT domain protein